MALNDWLALAGVVFCAIYIVSNIALLVLQALAANWEKPHVETNLETYRRSRSGDSSRSDR